MAWKISISPKYLASIRRFKRDVFFCRLVVYAYILLFVIKIQLVNSFA